MLSIPSSPGFSTTVGIITIAAVLIYRHCTPPLWHLAYKQAITTTAKAQCTVGRQEDLGRNGEDLGRNGLEESVEETLGA